MTLTQIRILTALPINLLRAHIHIREFYRDVERIRKDQELVEACLIVMSTK